MITPKECPGNDTKQSEDEVPVMMELWGMRCTSSLPSLPCSLWLRLVAPDMVHYMGRIELKCVFTLNWTVWNRTVFDFETVFRLKGIGWIKTVRQNWIAWNRNVLRNCVLMLNWIVWSSIVYLYKNLFGIK